MGKRKLLSREDLVLLPAGVDGLGTPYGKIMLGFAVDAAAKIASDEDVGPGVRTIALALLMVADHLENGGLSILECLDLAEADLQKRIREGGRFIGKEFVDVEDQ